MNNHQLLKAILRNDLGSFIHRTFQTVVPGESFKASWHIDAIAWCLTQCLEGDIRRLIITMPPRSLKSICASVAFPAWVLGRDPTKKIVCASYSENLAIKMARDCRAVMQSPWYRKIFLKTRIDREKNSELEFMTTQRGFRMATSVGGTLTGRGGNMIIIDDPIKPQDAMSEALREMTRQWYDNTLYTRLDDKTESVIILIMQRVHIDDLVGHVLEKEDWVHLNLPAIAPADQRIRISLDAYHDRAEGEVLHPEREPMEALERIKANIGTYNFNAQYLQTPMPPEGNLIRWGWFRFYKERPERGGKDQIVQSWDTASKAEELNNYSACTTWLVRGEEYYLLDVARERLEYPALKRRIVELAHRHEADAVLIEDKASGTSLIQDLREEGSIRPIPIEPEGDKVTRMSAQSAKLEGGRVLLPERAAWLGDFQTEVLQFPHGRHDDQVDSMSQFLGWIRKRSALRIKAWGQRIATLPLY